MNPSPAVSSPAVDRIAVPLGLLAIAGLAAMLAGWTGPDAPPARIDLLWVLLTSLPWVVAWMVAAAGFGALAQAVVHGGVGGHPVTHQLVLGVAVMLWLEAALGRLGLLQAGRDTGAWGLMVVGIALVAVQLFRAGRRGPLASEPVCWLCWTSAPALAVLLVAACSAPGWLWSTEFGGYDALSYHLQLPREWLGLGRIVPLEHNVYSALPGYMEGAYYHLAVLIGDGIESAYACQLLHAALAALAGLVTYRIGTAIAGRMTGSVAAVVLVGTPWVAVVGSLAYSEMATALLLAGGILVIADPEVPGPARAVLVGALAGVACGAKLTALGFVAAPLGVLLLSATPPRRWPAAIALTGAAGLLALAPYLVSNSLHFGNPVFPFATDLLGAGPWTAEQAAIWREAHRGDVPGLQRITDAFNQWLRFGLGPNPTPDEPWRPQWLILGWLAAAGLLVAALMPRVRAWSGRLALMLLLQLLFWVTLTHVKSRFMLPSVVPAALAVGLGLSWMDRTRKARPGMRGRGTGAGRVAPGALAVLLPAWCAATVLLFRTEPGAADRPAARIGRLELHTGRGLDAATRAAIAEGGSVSVHLNHLLPKRSHVLLVGDAAPFYYEGSVRYQTTWDRGILSGIMAREPDRPDHWMARLAGDGFTHLLVNYAMLRRWERSGWNDPRLTADHLHAAVEHRARPVAGWQDGDVVLYELK